MRFLGYPPNASTRIKLYYASMSEWDKYLIAKAFCVPRDQNLKCVILVAIDEYRMGIDNLDIKFVIQ